MSFQTTLHAFFDARVAAFDFGVITFLIEAERIRREKGLERIHVAIVRPSKDRQILYPTQILKWHDDEITGHDLYGADHAQWRLNNIVLPCCRLFPSVQNVTVCDDGNLAEWILHRSKENIFPENYSLEIPLVDTYVRSTVIAANLGEDCQFVQAPLQARQYARQWLDARSNGRKCIPITLREASFIPERNSDLLVFGDFAQRLQVAGYFVFILRDIEKALDDHPEEFEGISSCPEAVFNLELRVALYEESHICIFTTNGPSQLCCFNRNVQYLNFQTGDMLNSNPPIAHSLGMEIGRTPPFANHFQKWIWKEQNADIYLDEVITLDNEIERSQNNGSYESKLAPNAKNREPLDILAKRIHRFPYSTENYNWGVLEAEHAAIFKCLKHCSTEVIEHTDNQIILATIYLQRQEWETSKSHYLKVAAAMDSPEPWILARLGIICELQSYDGEAMEFYEQAIRMDSRLALVHYRMGSLAQKNGDMDNATEYFQLSTENGEINQQEFAKFDELLEQLKLLDKTKQSVLVSDICRIAINTWRTINNDGAN